MENGVVIYELKSADVAYVEPINRLLAQLSSSPRTFTVKALEAIVQSGNSHLLLAEVDGVVAGMLTLCDYLAPTGRKMWIEDVVVDEAMRGRSIGRLL
ncbi:MAG: GNAT family N-acetyltransferase, partial [Bacteroidaceae bacterium]|nr:GNAT family N-acetyltransferase [Bacteroidaceae bacterium]